MARRVAFTILPLFLDISDIYTSCSIQAYAESRLLPIFENLARITWLSISFLPKVSRVTACWNAPDEVSGTILFIMIGNPLFSSPSKLATGTSTLSNSIYVEPIHCGKKGHYFHVLEWSTKDCGLSAYHMHALQSSQSSCMSHRVP
ncbi:hypothetical protein BDV12DRAFT_177562 [Aspergillus spectabilis]